MRGGCALASDVRVVSGAKMLAQTISLSIPLVAILAGIFLNHQALRELKADLKRELKADRPEPQDGWCGR
jgi:hypothetical protein